jgi:predicted nucleotidyltransferase
MKGDFMRTYDAIEKVSKGLIEDGACEAILIKGSIGRGEDDEYSDVDMYVVVREEEMEVFLGKRVEYLERYLPLIYVEHVNFVAEQIVAIFEDGLHFDMYTVSEDTLPQTDQVKVVYDPKEKFKDYKAELRIMSKEELVGHFNEGLYYLVEADAAYRRGNYPWASYIMSSAIANSAIILRYLYDKEHAYLGLKRINEVIPKELFSWVVEASGNLNKEGFWVANDYIIKILDYIIENIDQDIKSLLNLNFLQWIRNNHCFYPDN